MRPTTSYGHLQTADSGWLQLSAAGLIVRIDRLARFLEPWPYISQRTGEVGQSGGETTWVHPVDRLLTDHPKMHS